MTICVLLLAVMLLTGSGAVSADTRLSYTIEGDGPGTESILIRDGKVRLNMRGGPFWMLYDRSQSRMYMVYDATKEVQVLDTARFRETQEQLKAWQDEWAGRFFVYEQQVREMDAKFPNFGERMKNTRESLQPAMAKLRRIAKESGKTSPAIRKELENELGEIPTDEEMQDVYDWLAEYEKYESRHEMLIEESRKQYQWFLDNTMLSSRRPTGKRQRLAGYDCEQVE